MMQYSLGEFEELVLLTVATQQATAYAVSIHDSLTESLGKDVNVSAIHVALRRMEDKGFVKSRFGGITEERGGRRKKLYVVTALGKRILDEQHELRHGLYKRIPKTSFT